jgi:hypothetical protein
MIRLVYAKLRQWAGTYFRNERVCHSLPTDRPGQRGIPQIGSIARMRMEDPHTVHPSRLLRDEVNLAAVHEKLRKLA